MRQPPLFSLQPHGLVHPQGCKPSKVHPQGLEPWTH